MFPVRSALRTQKLPLVSAGIPALGATVNNQGMQVRVDSGRGQDRTLRRMTPVECADRRLVLRRRGARRGR